MRDYPIEGGRDHGATVSVYLKDPDGNGIELTYDRPRDQWFDEGGDFVLRNDRFAVHDLLDEEGAAMLSDRELSGPSTERCQGSGLRPQASGSDRGPRRARLRGGVESGLGPWTALRRP